MQFGYTNLPINKISIELIIEKLIDISKSGHLNDTSNFYLYLRKHEPNIQIFYVENTHEDETDIYLSGKYTRKIIENNRHEIALEILEKINFF
jgi:hypothetical protein